MSRRQTALAQGAAEPNPLTWHAAVTNFGAEFSVREALQARGIDTVLPVIRYWRIRNRKRIIAERPVFPRCVLFGMDHQTQSLIDFVSRYVRSDDGHSIIRKDEPARARSIVGIERIVRNADGNWAVVPTLEVWELRRQILTGAFDGTLRQDRARPELPPFIASLIEKGELPAMATFTHKEARRTGLKFSVAA